jgi:nucleotide-binding universal stress UspA family protein
MYKHILIPTDGSELSEKAVRAGIELARSVQADVTLLTASLPYHLVVGDAPIGQENNVVHYTRITEERAAQRFKPGEEYARTLGVPVRAEHVYAQFPHEAIVDAARRERFDLVCMASHGRKGLAALLIGSETQKVLTHSKVPVLVCR